jgi:hypothetical protein
VYIQDLFWAEVISKEFLKNGSEKKKFCPILLAGEAKCFSNLVVFAQGSGRIVRTPIS